MNKSITNNKAHVSTVGSERVSHMQTGNISRKQGQAEPTVVHWSVQDRTNTILEQSEEVIE